MPTIIDSLLVTLGLDSKGFDKGREKAKRDLKDLGTNADKTGASFEGIAKQATKFLALIGGAAAIKHFTMDVIESSSALDRLAKNLETGVDTISAWSNAADIAGGSASGLQGTMDMLSRSQTELQLTGQSGLIPYFSALGVAMADVHGKARPVDDILLDLSDRFSRMDRSTANNMGRMMGIDQGTMQLLLKGRSEVELMIKRQKEHGAVTKKQAEEASKLREEIVKGRQTFEAFGRELVSMATPALEKLFAVFADLGAWVQANKEFVGDFLTIIAGGLAAIALATMPINVTAVAIVALGAAIAALYQDYQTWKRGGDSFFGDDWARLEGAINTAKTALLGLKKVAGDVFYRAFAAGDAIMSAYRGDTAHAVWAAHEFMTGAPDETPAPAKAPPAPAKTGGNASMFADIERRNGLPAGLLDKMWAKESNRGKRMTSPVGAQGHFQFMPATAKQFGLSDPNNLAQSADAAGRYMGQLVKKYNGDVNMALAAYNWGSGNVDRKGMGAAPKETRDYVRTLGSGASQFAQGSGAASTRGGASVAGGSNVETHIGEVKIYTAATDATGIANDMQRALGESFTSQANPGLF